MTRPMPPAELARFVPAEGVAEWVEAQIVGRDGSLHNPDHLHLMDADISYLWAPCGFAKRGRTVIGQAEEVMFRTSGWSRWRQEQQLQDWFGREPAFIITLDAEYCATCSDAAWCALVEHELYHIGQAKDEFGAPKFTKDGLPKLEIRGHDVEEFVGVVRRYGVGDPESGLARLVQAAREKPEVMKTDIAGACGTCLLRAA